MSTTAKAEGQAKVALLALAGGTVNDHAQPDLPFYLKMRVREPKTNFVQTFSLGLVKDTVWNS